MFINVLFLLVAVGADARQMANDDSREAYTPLFGRTATCSSSVLVKCLANGNVPIKLGCGYDWDLYSKGYNRRISYTPAVVAVPSTNNEVATALQCASKYGVSVQAKSGGHSYASYSLGGSDGAMVIDLRNFKQSKFIGNGIVEVGSGFRLGELASYIYEKERRALAHGTCPGVGLGGHFTHGGYGYSSRAWGLAMDQIVAMTVVLASGEIKFASKDQNQDLFYVG